MAQTAVVVGPIRAGDVPALAALHKKAFPDFFLSSLGEPFLRQFYAGFPADPTAVSVVARSESGRVLGAAVGTTEPAGFFSRLLRRRWLPFALASVGQAMRHPSSVPRLLRAVRYRGGSHTPPDGALLSSICVDPAQRGTGLGRLLLSEWAREAGKNGSTVGYLTTDADHNDAVNDFYRSQGWFAVSSFRTPEGRAMNLYSKPLGQPC